MGNLSGPREGILHISRGPQLPYTKKCCLLPLVAIQNLVPLIENPDFPPHYYQLMLGMWSMPYVVSLDFSLAMSAALFWCYRNVLDVQGIRRSSRRFL